ncbi:50S ribosomal protein L4 [Methylococcus geothermalis]|uniref:Large ribosomal subunit protein uL4 n=1 Tax=Methylococcus geothermalis TaxID=2681310 RepID=A0A858QBH5_9GAMM|nr:50S ribosomal protein L4 [Methylococcus geothermalis]QJD31065.1 50S ribosomal protein L4 [Methylococcus geothermalis]
MSLSIPKIENGSAGNLEVSDKVFGQGFNESLVHQLVVGYLAAARSGTKAQKSRSDVSGGGKKPWKQKGSGHARAGTTRGPLWRTGGVTFAASNRNYRQKLNKKMYRAAVRSIFSELLRQGRLVVSDSIVPGTPKTRELAARLKSFGEGYTVILAEQLDLNLALSSRNLPNVSVNTTDTLSPVDLVHAERVIATSSAIRKLEVRLS